MASEKIDLTKKKYVKNQYTKVIDTEFSQLAISPTLQNKLSPNNPSPISSVGLVDDFFDQYNRLFYTIPKFGENSHEFLIKQSSEYIQEDLVLADYQALINEINTLQQQILDLNQQIVDITTSSSNGRTNS